MCRMVLYSLVTIGLCGLLGVLCSPLPTTTIYPTTADEHLNKTDFSLIGNETSEEAVIFTEGDINLLILSLGGILKRDIHDMQDEDSTKVASLINEYEDESEPNGNTDTTLTSSDSMRWRRDDSTSPSTKSSDSNRRKRNISIEPTTKAFEAERRKKEVLSLVTTESNDLNRRKRDDSTSPSTESDDSSRRKRDDSTTPTSKTEASDRKKRAESSLATTKSNDSYRRKRDDSITQSTESDDSNRRKRDDATTPTTESVVSAFVTSDKKKRESFQSTEPSESSKGKIDSTPTPNLLSYPKIDNKLYSTGFAHQLHKNDDDDDDNKLMTITGNHQLKDEEIITSKPKRSARDTVNIQEEHELDKDTYKDPTLSRYARNENQFIHQLGALFPTHVTENNSYNTIGIDHEQSTKTSASIHY